MRSAAAGVAAVSVALGGWLAAGCARRLELLPEAGVAADSNAPPGGDAPRSCQGLGPPIQLERDAVSQCTGALAAVSHRFALCVCSSLTLEQPLRSDAFDSTGLTATDTTTAAVGIAGKLSTGAAIDIGGALYASGAGATTVASFETTESLRVGGPLAAGSAGVRIGTDAYVAGDVSGDVEVTGTLHVPAGSSVDALVRAGALAREPVNLPDPCECSSSLVDLARAVTSARATNDNLAVGLAADALVGSEAPSVLDLPCGTFVLDGIELASDLRLNVHGRSELVVVGDVSLQASLAVILDPGAELDLVLAGKLAVSGGAMVGSKAAPARFRIWTASTETVELEDAPIIGAVLYAPRAEVDAPSGVDFYGSVRAAGFSAEGRAVLHYDRAVLSAGLPCGFPAQAAVH
jgi:hypothetical protein